MAHCDAFIRSDPRFGLSQISWRTGVAHHTAGRHLGPVMRYQAGHPALRQPVSPGYLPLAAALRDNSGDDQARPRHPPTLPG
jgi:hypothetical protein